MSDMKDTRKFVRFEVLQRIEHLFLLLSFSLLAITGLPQRYADNSLSLWIIEMFGGIENTRSIHHISAIVLIVLSLFHDNSKAGMAEETLVRSARLMHQEFKGRVGALKLISGLLEVFETFDKFLCAMVLAVNIDSHRLGLRRHAALARKFRNENPPLIADHIGLNMLTCAGIFAYGVGVPSAFMSKGAVAHKGLIGARSNICQLVDMM